MLLMLASFTLRHRGIGTGISEASKRVPIFPFATHGGKQASSYLRQSNWVQAQAEHLPELLGDMTETSFFLSPNLRLLLLSVGNRCAIEHAGMTSGHAGVED